VAAAESVDPDQGVSDEELHTLIVARPRDGWRLFIEQYTPELVRTIRRAGVREHDEVMEIYTRVSEHLADDRCARLRRYDPAKGRLGAWLSTVVRRLIVDWVRSESGRKRLFQSIRALGPIDRRVFELYYWRRRPAGEIAEIVRLPVTLVFESLERIEQALSQRQRAELLAMAARDAGPAPLEHEDGTLTVDIGSDAPGPDDVARAREASAALSRALAALPAEDALIVSMRFVDGLSRAEVARALHLTSLSGERIAGILARLKALLEEHGVDRGDAALHALGAEGRIE
jgi:DNA-directed RNA polymerase specialized sigma24 family protein